MKPSETNVAWDLWGSQTKFQLGPFDPDVSKLTIEQVYEYKIWNFLSGKFYEQEPFFVLNMNLKLIAASTRS